MLKAVFFDLDGTLLPLDEPKFLGVYMEVLLNRMIPAGLKKENILNFSSSSYMAMVLNDGSKMNHEVFVDKFKEIHGHYTKEDADRIDDFYDNDFDKSLDVCGYNPLAKEIVKFVKDNGLICVLSTNPVFPMVAQVKRMARTGLEVSDFDYITSYENSRFCKPNPNYFIDLLNKFNLKPDEVIVIGNNTYEDGECSLGANIKCYLVRDCLIDHPKATHQFEIIEMNQVIDKIKEWLCK